MVPVGSGQHDPRPAHPTEDIGLYRDPDPLAPAIAPSAGIGIPPAPITQVVDRPPCGRPQPSQQPFARSNRITAESCAQSIG